MKMHIRKRGTSFQLDCGYVYGKRVQLSFKTRAEAEAEKYHRTAEWKRLGASANQVTDAERAEYVRWRDRLAEVGATVEEACTFFLRHGQARSPLRFEELAAACIAAKGRIGLSEAYLKQMKSTFRGACSGGFGDVEYFELLMNPASTDEDREVAREISHGVMSDAISTRMISDLLMNDRFDWSPKTQQGYRTNLTTLFSWAMENGHAAINPASAAEIQVADWEREVEYYPAEACRALLLRTWTEEPELLPWVVMKLFTGVRTEELVDMKMSAIHLATREVVVMGAKRRSRRRRVVDLEPVAVSWLELCQELGVLHEDFGFYPPNFRKRWESVRPDPFIRNGLRHTFPTMHYAMFRDESSLQALMAHRSAAVLHDCYRAAASPREAEEFWSMVPAA